MAPGRAGMIHDYKLNGTTDSFAAMNVATGQVLIHCQKCHTAKDALALMAKSRHSSLRTLQRYARPSVDAVAALTAAHDPAARRR